MTLDLAAELRAELARRNVTGKEIAAHLQTYPEKISRTLNGNREMTVNEFIDIATAIGTDPAHILTNAIKRKRNEKDNTNETQPK